MNEYLSFRIAHGIDNKKYTDLYLGDYFKVMDGTYNAVWMVAHFDYFNHVGGDGQQGVVLIPRTVCGDTKMYAENVTTNGYAGSIAQVTTCPAIATALSAIFGSYLLTNKLMLTTNVDSNAASMSGANRVGGATLFNWTTTQCSLMSEPQVYGTTVVSSSFCDVGEANRKFAIFNFINTIEYGYYTFWLRAVADYANFGIVNYNGCADRYPSNNTLSARPLIYIG